MAYGTWKCNIKRSPGTGVWGHEAVTLFCLFVMHGYYESSWQRHYFTKITLFNCRGWCLQPPTFIIIISPKKAKRKMIFILFKRRSLVGVTGSLMLVERACIQLLLICTTLPFYHHDDIAWIVGTCQPRNVKINVQQAPIDE